MNKDICIKYIIVGDSSVGKSCLLKQFIDKRFEPLHNMTIGLEFGYYYYNFDGKKVKLQIWDTAGQEVFHSITRSFYRDTVCALLVFDITNRTSYNHIKSWLTDISTYNTNINIIKILVGNKYDLKHKRVILEDEILEFANKNKLTYFETSAKTSYNVNQIFLTQIPRINFLISTKQIEIPIDDNKIYLRDKIKKSKCCKN